MTPTVGNMNLQMLQTQTKSVFGQLTSAYGGEYSSYINTIFNSLPASEIQALVEGEMNSDQQAQVITSLQNKIGNALTQILGMIGANESAKASKETAEQERKAEQANEELKQKKAELDEKLKEVQGGIEYQNNRINLAVDNLEVAQALIEEKKQEINRIIEQIVAQQELLKAEKDPEKQVSILENIQALSCQIETLVLDTTQVEETINHESQEVADAYTEIETAKGNTVDITAEGQAVVTEGTQQIASTAQESAATQVTGVANNATGAALETAAAAASSNMFTAAEAPDLYMKASDQLGAGATRTASALLNLQTLRQGIGALAECSDILTNFDNSIGSLLGDFENCIGGWNSSIDSVITSLGTIGADSSIYAENAALEAAVMTDLTNIDAQQAQKTAPSMEDQLTTEAGKEMEYTFQPAQAEQSENNLLTPKVKVTPFGI